MASRTPHAPLHSHGHILAHDEEAFTGNDDHIYEPHYTVLIRVPVNRGDFIDPQPVDWDLTRDQALWALISETARLADVDWKALAVHFDVSLAFLLQQVAWLYQRQLLRVREHMKRVKMDGSSEGEIITLPSSLGWQSRMFNEAKTGIATTPSTSPSHIVGTESLAVTNLQDPIAPSAISTRGDLRHTLNTLQLMPRLGTQLSRTYDGAQISHRLAANVARNTSPTSSDRTSSPASRSRSYEAPTPERSKALRRPMKLHFFAGDQGRQASPSRTSNGEVRGDAYAESEEEDEEKGPAFLVFEHEGLVTVKDKQVTTLKPANTGHERSTVEPRESMSIQ